MQTGASPATRIAWRAFVILERRDRPCRASNELRVPWPRVDGRSRADRQTLRVLPEEPEADINDISGYPQGLRPPGRLRITKRTLQKA